MSSRYSPMLRNTRQRDAICPSIQKASRGVSAAAVPIPGGRPRSQSRDAGSRSWRSPTESRPQRCSCLERLQTEFDAPTAFVLSQYASLRQQHAARDHGVARKSVSGRVSSNGKERRCFRSGRPVGGKGWMRRTRLAGPCSKRRRREMTGHGGTSRPATRRWCELISRRGGGGRR